CRAAYSTVIMAPNTPRWPSPGTATDMACSALAARWVLQRTTRSRRRSTPRSNARCSARTGSSPTRGPREPKCSPTSTGSTSRGGIRHLGTAPRSTSNDNWIQSQRTCKRVPFLGGIPVPTDSLGGSEFYIGQIPPFGVTVDEFGFVQTDRGFHQSVVVGVADRPDRGLEAGLGQVGGEAETGVLTARIRVMYQALAVGPVRGGGPVPLPQGVIDRVEHELGVLGRRCGPPVDRPGIHVDDRKSVV